MFEIFENLRELGKIIEEQDSGIYAFGVPWARPTVKMPNNAYILNRYVTPSPTPSAIDWTIDQ